MGPNGEVPPLDGLESVDFVTKPGAGGIILEMRESAKAHKNLEENKLDKELIEALEALKTSFTALSTDIKEALTPSANETAVEDETPSLSVGEALKVAKAIEEAELPEGATERVVAIVESGGDYKEAIAGEVAYVASIREAATKLVEVDDGKKEPARVTGFKKAGK